MKRIRWTNGNQPAIFAGMPRRSNTTLRLSLHLSLLIGLAIAPACRDRAEPAATARPAGSPLAELAPASDARYDGVVRACLRAGSYSYLEVELADGAHRWAVSMGPALAVGTAVRVEVFGARTDFHSPRLGRTFATLDFAHVDAV